MSWLFYVDTVLDRQSDKKLNIKYFIKLKNTHLPVPIQHPQIRTRLFLTKKARKESRNL
jgi:hypothetical protein